MSIQRLLDCVAALAMMVLLFLAAPVSAQTFPQLTGRVVDQAHLLTPAEIADLSTKSATLEAQTGRQFVIATVNSLEGHEIEDYAYRLGRFWKIGTAKNDDGVLMLVAPNERKVWIATGYGAGGFMTDAMSGIIIRENILPHFKQKPPDYGGGIEAGADAIIKQMSLPPEEAQKNVAAAQQTQEKRQHSGAGALPVVFWLMIIGFVVLSHFRRAQGRRYKSGKRRSGGISPWVVLWGLNELANSGRRGGWGGGGWGGGGFGGGGGFSGGGGSFGGGGAGGSW